MRVLEAVISSHLEDILAMKGLEKSTWASMLQPSREASQGDLTLPCFPFASTLKMAPQAIADELAASFPNIDALLHVTSMNGYLNFTAHPEWLAEAVTVVSLCAFFESIFCSCFRSPDRYIYAPFFTSLPQWAA